MPAVNRREFIKRTTTAGLLATGLGWSAAALPATRHRLADAFEQIELGQTGIKTSFLAQGTGVNGSRRSSAHTRMGHDACVKLLREGIDRGLTFIDAADLYGTHPYVRDALREVPRDQYTLLSKIWTRDEDWNDFSGGARAEFDRFRREFGTETIDIVLLHCMIEADWPTTLERARDELSELKEQGDIRAVGVSCHDYGALKTAASHPWVDVIFARINSEGHHMDGTQEEISAVLRTARANGKAVVGMKIFGVGRVETPERREASLRYVIDNELVDAMTIGMLQTEHMDDNILRIGRVLRS